MNGPEHFRRAEALLHDAQLPGQSIVDDEGRVVEVYAHIDEVVIQAAQVHATLALAAATMTVGLGMSGDTVTEWSRLVAVPRPTCSVKGCGLNRSMESDHCLGHTRERGDVAS